MTQDTLTVLRAVETALEDFVYYGKSDTWSKSLADLRTLIASMEAAKQVQLEDLLGAIARGWCHTENSSKVMDASLAVAIAKEVQSLYTHPQPVSLEAAEPAWIVGDDGLPYPTNGYGLPGTKLYTHAQPVEQPTTPEQELCIDEGCDHHGIPHICITKTSQPVEQPEQGKVFTEAESQAAIDKLKAQEPLVPPQLRDPCPGCDRGTVCRTPNCGRLKLPPNHPHAVHSFAKPAERCKHGVWLSDHCYSCELEDKKP